ncbi:alpha-hydroxy acid oxidase [Pseudomonas putida]|uniref:alpha-hydroxy acid oxidase n=1 Tax=Pseudomonas putida TaxID=303 RepID=UPI0018AB32CD|nr:alpha-hydroxy acid oxidase [Pseudomonas putida]MBF8659436.1 alpha-hydroxy-acid oxidizing protein [Pseudomonas putida]
MINSNVEDLRQRAREKLPKMFFDYIDGGAFGERTLAWNIDDFDRWSLEQQIMVDLSERNLGTHFLGAEHRLPFMLGPVGFAGMFWPDGEVQAARAAAQAGIPMCLSTFSINSIEEVAACMPGSLSFQLYVFRDRVLAADLLAKARAAGVETLFVTADTDISSVRERDTRNGFRTASSLNLSALLDLASRPGWCWRMAGHGKPQLGNVRGRAGLPNNLMSQASYLSGNVDPSMTWRDLAWLRERWPGRIVIKGVLSTADTQRAMDEGLDSIVVSNHGGRQLDGARSSIVALPEIAEYVDGRMEILFDGGVRRGSQIVKALALGADAVLLGRAFAYGLAAGGQQGVSEALEFLRTETEITLALMGVTSIEQLKANRSSLIRQRV